MKDQRENIKKLFESRPLEWIPCYELAKIALQYNARIFSLRNSGMVIRNKTEITENGKHSWFRFVPADKSGQLRLL